MAEFIARNPGQAALLRTTQPDALARGVTAAGGSVASTSAASTGAGDPGHLQVRGLTEDQVADIAFASGIPCITLPHPRCRWSRRSWN